MSFGSLRSTARVFVAALLFLSQAGAEAGPVITNLSPNPFTAGEFLTIQGTGFGNTKGTVVLNGIYNSTDNGAMIGIQTWSDTNITCLLNPPYVNCSMTIVVTNGSGTKVGSSPYQLPFAPPMTDGPEPSSGTPLGGVTVQLAGNDFVTNMIVIVGDTVASNIAGSDSLSSWSFVLPPGQGIVPISLVACGITNTTGFSFSYDPPSILTVQPRSGSTMGGTLLTIVGNDFGTNGTVTINSNNCTVFVWSNSQITCSTPPGQGFGLTLQVNVANYHASYPWSYSPPTVTSFFPDPMDPVGGLLTIQGTNFGTNGTVTVGGVNCPATNWGQTQIVCTVPPGVAANAGLVVTVGGQSFATSFGYAQPTISGVSPSNGPTAGGTMLVISGAAFGSGGTVALGGKNCVISNWSDSQITCVLPAGQGTNQAVVVTDGAVSTLPFEFNYLPPSISGESPPLLPTAGGVTVTIVGTDFGTSGSVSLGSSVCQVNTWSQNQVTCVSPAGQGTNLPMIVTVEGQASSPLPVSYAPPSIINLSTNTAPTSGQTVLTISGTNFGTTGTVTINGTICPIITWSNAQILCITPAGSGTGLILEVTVGSQVSNPEVFSYYSTTTPCVPGTYSTTGFEPGVLAPPGYYVASSGATNPTPADPGSYVATQGATNETPASAGFYCPVAAMTSPIPAAPGYYVPTNGATAQIPAPAGQYVPVAGSSAYSPPPAGTFAPIMGMQGTVFLGSTNGTSVVTQAELDMVLSNYWPNSPWIMLTNFQQLQNGLLQFALTNQTGWDFSVLTATNLADTNWSYLGIAYPVYQFNDTNTNAGSQYYKLRWP